MMKLFNIKTALLLLVFLLCGCNEKLSDQLSERQANEIITLLESNNIDAFKVDSGKGKYSIQVSSDTLASATVLLTTYNLPSADDIEISQQFPADAMVSTPMGEKARLISAIEQRLGQSLQELEHITSARVHLSYPGISPENNDSSSMVASVLITYQGTIDESAYTDKIRRFIKNGLQDMHYENISVVMFRQSAPLKLVSIKSSYPIWGYTVIIASSVLLLVLILLGVFWPRISQRFFSKKETG